jgi:hypothetical protein
VDEQQRKRCTGCGEDLPIEAFAWKDRATGRRHSRCRTCVQEYQRRWYTLNGEAHRATSAAGRRRRHASNRAIVAAAKDVPCADCGQRFRTVEMDFDHVRGEKSANVAHLLWNATPERVEAEIAKCDVVCAVCHRLRTHGRAP